MSKLTVTTIDTIDDVTDLTIKTGNTSGPKIIVSSIDNTVGIYGALNVSSILVNGSPTYTFNNGPLGGFRNKIINGDFDIWQRGTSFSANGYGPDRWYLAGSGTFTVTLQTTGAPLGATNVCRIAYGASSSFCNIRQALESSQVDRLKGKTVTLGVMVRRNSSFAANLSLILQKNATANTMLGGTWSAISSISVSNALLPIGTGKTDWYLLKMTAAIPDDGTANGLRISIIESSVGGSGEYWELGHVYIVEGDATAETDPFAPRHIQQELALCQRYFRKTGTIFGIWTNSTTLRVNGSYSPQMRATPTTTLKSATPYAELYNQTAYIGSGSTIIGGALGGESSIDIAVNGFTTTNVYGDPALLNADIWLDAEL